MDFTNDKSSFATTGASTDHHKPHVVILPFPVLGRTNPLLQFAKCLSSKGLQVTIATTPSFAASSNNLLPRSFPCLTIATISDDSNQSQLSLSNNTINVDDMIEGFERLAPRWLEKLIKEQKESVGNPVRCLVYDSSFTWALGVAREHGIYAAPFFPQSCAVSLLFYHVFKGSVASPPLSCSGAVSAPGLPVMEVRDLPTFVREVGRYPLLEKVALRQFENFDKADWQFFNTFDLLEKEVVNWMSRQWPRVKTIGPTIPSMYLDKSLEDDKEYGLSLFNPEYDTCIQWLDTKADGSTIFISFGSLAALGEEQMEELASGFKNSNKPFLWVVRASEQNKLPPNFKHELSSEHGLIVNWCPQLAVLAHRAVGCFFTHCGWNSTLETISLGVPIVAMPQWSDQPTNGKFVEDIWRVGIRVKANGNGIVGKEEIESCIREIMEGTKGEEMRSNGSKWKMQANAAMEEGGSSDRNIEDFVEKIKSRSYNGSP